MRVLVCGGRDYNDRAHIFRTLSRLDVEYGPFTHIIHGAQTGADSEAMAWARAEHINHTAFRAEWLKYGIAAGPIRNRRMIQVGKPDLVIAFPGGAGTKNMVKEAQKAEIKVIEIEGRE